MLKIPRKLQFIVLFSAHTISALIKASTQYTFGVDDFILHLLGYTVLMISAIYAFGRHYLNLAVMLLAYSVLIELIQYFLPYRMFSFRDILANLCGLVTGIIIWNISVRLGKKISTGPEQ